MVDSNEAPVAGALVVAMGGDRRYFTESDGARAAAPPAMRARTDTRGEFIISGVPPAVHPIVVRAAGHGPWKGSVETIAGTTTDVRVQLSAGVVVRGVASDGDGNPVEGAEVRAGKWGDVAGASARTAADGTYRLDDASPGEIEVVARKTAVGTASAILHATAGEILKWDPTLRAGLKLALRVVDEREAPLPAWTLELQAVSEGGWDARTGRTGPDGRFTADNCAFAPYTVTVSSPAAEGVPLARAEGLHPGAPEVWIDSAFPTPVSRTPSSREPTRCERRSPAGCRRERTSEGR